METMEIRVRGMTCSSCEKLIESELSIIGGVKGAKASAQEGTVHVFLDKEVGRPEIESAIGRAGYQVGHEGGFVAIALALAAVLAALYLMLGEPGASFSPDSDASFAALFLLGFLTGFHCIGMCGGFVLSYSLSGRNSLPHHLSYAGGRLLSYTAIGAIFGLIGSAIAFSVEMRAAAALVAGAFLLLYGLGMLGIIPRFASGQIRLPAFAESLLGKIRRKGPAAIGLLNGLMIACGPLQAMYVFAAATGDALAGASALFAFGLGTLPAMFALGMLGSAIGLNRLRKYVRYSGVLVIFLGMIMVANGLALSGHAITLPGTTQDSQDAAGGTALSGNGYQEIYMNITRYGYEPNSFVLQKGVPVRWIINGEELNYCNNAIIAPEYGLDFSLEEGEQTIEFTPQEAGTFGWSCWMGMIPGVFVVVDNGPSSDGAGMQGEPLTEEEIAQEVDAALASTAGGTCGGSCGGGCGCGCSAR